MEVGSSTVTLEERQQPGATEPGKDGTGKDYPQASQPRHQTERR